MTAAANDEPSREARSRDIRGIIELALRLAPGGAGPYDRSSLAPWDSLKHIEIMFLVEDWFEVRFAEEDIPGLDSLERLVDKVEALLAARRHG